MSLLHVLYVYMFIYGLFVVNNILFFCFYFNLQTLVALVLTTGVIFVVFSSSYSHFSVIAFCNNYSQFGTFY